MNDNTEKNEDIENRETHQASSDKLRQGPVIAPKTQLDSANIVPSNSPKTNPFNTIVLDQPVDPNIRSIHNRSSSSIGSNSSNQLPKINIQNSPSNTIRLNVENSLPSISQEPQNKKIIESSHSQQQNPPIHQSITKTSTHLKSPDRAQSRLPSSPAQPRSPTKETVSASSSTSIPATTTATASYNTPEQTLTPAQDHVKTNPLSKPIEQTAPALQQDLNKPPNAEPTTDSDPSSSTALETGTQQKRTSSTSPIPADSANIDPRTESNAMPDLNSPDSSLNDQKYFDSLSRDITSKSQRVDALMKTLGLDSSLYESDYPSFPPDGQEFKFPIPPIDFEIESKLTKFDIKEEAQESEESNQKQIRAEEKEKENIEKPVYYPKPADLLLKRDLESSLLSEATLLVKTTGSESNSNGTNSNGSKLKIEDNQMDLDTKPNELPYPTNEGASSRIFSPKVLVKLAYLEALKQSIEGHSYSTKGGLTNIQTPALSFVLAARHLETYSKHLENNRNRLSKYQENLKADIEFETNLKEEVEKIKDLSISGLRKTQEQINDLENESTKSDIHDKILIALAKRRKSVKDEVDRLMGCLKFVIDDHLAPHIAESAQDILRTSSLFSHTTRPVVYYESKKRDSNGNIIDITTENRIPGSNLLRNSEVIEITDDEEEDEDEEEEEKSDDDEEMDDNNDIYMTSPTDHIKSANKTHSHRSLDSNGTKKSPERQQPKDKFPAQKELQPVSDYQDQEQTAARLREILLSLLNQYLDSTENRTLYMQIPNLDDPLIRMLLNCQIIIQSPDNPLLIRLREFGKPLTSSSKFQITIP